MTRPSEYVVQVDKVRNGSRQHTTPLTYHYMSPLRVGDRVMCPGNEFSGPFLAEVTQLGSDYQGSTRSLLCRVAPDRKHA